MRLWKLAVTAGPALIVLLFVALVGSLLSRSTRHAADVARSYQVELTLERLLSRLKDAETAERGFLLTGDERYLEPYRGSRADAGRALRDLRRLIRDPGQRARLDSLGPLVARRLDLNDAHIATRRSRGEAAGEAALRTGRGKAAMDSVRARVAAMDRVQALLLARRAELERRNARQTAVALALGAAVTAALTLLTHYLLLRYTGAQARAARELEEQNRLLEQQAVEMRRQQEHLEEQAQQLELGAEARARSERRFRSLIENSHDMITVLDAQGVVQYESPTARRTTGPRLGRMLESDGFARIHPEDRAAVRELLHELRGLPGGSVIGRLRYSDDQGRWRVVEAMGTNLLHDEAVQGIVVNSRDVTEREEAQAETRAQRAYLRAVIDASPSMIFAKDAEGRFMLANTATASVFGMSPDALIGRREAEIHPHPEEAAKFADDDREVLATGREKLIPEERITDSRTGEVRWLQTRKVRLTPPGGAEPQVLGIATDITDRKLAEDALIRAQEELRQVQKLEAVGRLAGGVAHDFNNILTAVRGFAQVLLMDVPEGNPMREDLLEIDRAGERGAALARQLLAFSRRQVLRPQRLDLNEVIRGTQRMLSRVIGEDVELVMELAPGAAPVLADPGQMEQVLMNLLVNARDAMSAGGRVTVATRLVDGTEPSAHGGGRGVLLTVADTGHGMDRATQERIFEPFFTTKPLGKGTGLGLSTVYGIVTQSGGDVRVESEPGRGARFTISLPAAPAADGPAAASASAAPGPAPAATVLLVEDERPVRVSVRRMLEQMGFAVLEAADGHEALRICATYTAALDVVLTDVVMPGMRGTELAERVSAVRPGIGVAFMSGYASGDGAGDPSAPLPASLLQKPFSAQQLAEHVRGALA